MNYSELPKIELHLHLDCSLSYEVVRQLDPSVTLVDYKENFITPAKCTDLADYIKRSQRSYELMQSEASLRLVTLDLFKQLKADHVIYAEIRFAPLLHIAGGLSPEEVVSAVNKATVEGIEKYNIETGIILCTLRHFSEDQSMKTVELVNKFKGTSVVGFDIAADEAGFPIDNHIKAFQFAKDNGIKCTAHAGEARGAKSVWETLEHFHPQRIGHGVRSAEDEELLEFLKSSNIHLEVCPTSNIQVNVFDTIEDHTANKIYNTGVSMSINTDCRTISNVTLTHEYDVMDRIFHWKLEHFKKCNLEAVAHSFASQDVKDRIKSLIKKAY
jgi:adenosine deaminase